MARRTGRGDAPATHWNQVGRRRRRSPARIPQCSPEQSGPGCWRAGRRRSPCWRSRLASVPRRRCTPSSRACCCGPCPYADGTRWTTLYSGRTTEPGQFGSSTFPDLQEYQRRAASFDAFGWFTSSTRSLTSPGEPRHVTIVSVTPNLVPALGIAPALGHWFTDNRGAAISDALWRALGADPRIVGTSLTLDGVVFTVNAVMPPRFVLPVAAPGTEGVVTDVWIELDPSGAGRNRDEGLYFAYARLKPGVTFGAATAEVHAIGADLARRDPIGHDAYMSKLEDLHEVGVREQRPTLVLLLSRVAVAARHRLRERRRPAARAIGRARPGNRDARRARRLGEPAGVAVLRRGRDRVDRRRRARHRRERPARSRGDPARPRLRASHVGRRDGLDRAGGRTRARSGDRRWRPRSRRCGRRDRRRRPTRSKPAFACPSARGRDACRRRSWSPRLRRRSRCWSPAARSPCVSARSAPRHRDSIPTIWWRSPWTCPRRSPRTHRRAMATCAGSPTT